jgi:hypothetical protein
MPESVKELGWGARRTSLVGSDKQSPSALRTSRFDIAISTRGTKATRGISASISCLARRATWRSAHYRRFSILLVIAELSHLARSTRKRL